MDPPATPGPSRSANNPTFTPGPTTPGGRQRTLHQSTPHDSNSPFPASTPRTPGGTAVKPCTVDESLYSRVTVHTAKCTECDKRNMDTMRRCPGCTFQVCQPCYDKRQREGKGLVHGNMSMPSANGSASATGGGRTVRKRPVASTPGGGSFEKKANVLEKEQDEDTFATEKESARDTLKSASRKRAMKRPRVEDCGPGKVESSEDEFDPDNTSPTPSKRRRTNLSFAESALATALRTPPATRARRKPPNTSPTHSPAPSAPLDIVKPRTSVVRTPSEHPLSDLLYRNAVQGYDEPLLGRREPIMSDPVIHIPAIIKRGGKPRSSAEQVYANIQSKLAEKMQQKRGLEIAQEGKSDTLAAQKEKAEDWCTVRAFVEREATKHLDHVVMDEDENKAVFNAMESAALVWGKQTYNRLDPATQKTLQPGLKLRLDRIDNEYTTELKKLMDEHAARMLRGLSGEDDSRSMPQPPSFGRLFKPA
ncbi:hypothetical protein DDE82_000027 [Stemphylium lycopersici]|nr:hypothetical protein DDE82_000027 [Stemphylium lycopersici]